MSPDEYPHYFDIMVRIKALEDGSQLITDRLMNLTANEAYIENLLSDAEKAEKVITKIKVLENRAQDFDRKVSGLISRLDRLDFLDDKIEGHFYEIQSAIASFEDEISSLPYAKDLVKIATAIKMVRLGEYE